MRRSRRTALAQGLPPPHLGGHRLAAAQPGARRRQATRPGADIEPVIIRGEPGPALVEIANSGDDLLIVGAGTAVR
jgi:hypothetical protein